MKKFAFTIFLIFLILNGFCQEKNAQRQAAISRLASMERVRQSGQEFPDYPQIFLPSEIREIALPAMVDNSEQPFMRPVYNQEQSASCQQASTILYNYCYEVNRLRNLPSDTNINQYPDHFAWNFMNATEPYYGEGVSYFHTFDIMHDVGNPTVSVYGEIRDHYYWMSNYDGYFQAMHNRISGANSIYVGNPEGLLVLKHWLFDHLEGSEVGGVASFGTGLPYSPPLLPEGTPESGKHVEISLLYPASHALTIVGYNDSIRYDVNGDGLYTNNIDITGDTLVDMRDWEIGGLKFVNSYGTSWADSGYCYMLYRTLALKYREGGIWNNSVHIVFPDTVSKPMLTIKSTVQYNKRGRIKLLAGIATDTSQYYPEHIRSFSIFNYQGGDFGMTGINNVDGDILELGLDITPLLSYVENNKPYRIFLMVDENDPNEKGFGSLLDFSVLHYSGQESVEFRSTETPLGISNNSRSIASVLVVSPSNPIDFLPHGSLCISSGSDTAIQFRASGGFPPYTWKLKQVYHETENKRNYLPINGTILHPDGILSGFAEVPLPFSFPFFGKNYDTLYMHVNGYILFDKQDMPYYYLLFDENYLHQIRAISGYMNHDMGEIGVEDNISNSSCSDSIVFQWRTSANEGSGTVMFSTTLYPDGRIRHHYGPNSAQTTLIPVIGLGDGTPENTLISKKSGIVPAEGDIINFIPSDVPASLSMSIDGLLSVPKGLQHYSDEIIVQAVDSQRLFREKTLVLTSGLEIRVRPLDSLALIQPGDVVPLLLELINHGNDSLHDVSLHISPTSMNCAIPVNNMTAFDLFPHQNRLIDNYFSIQISDSVVCPEIAGIDIMATTTGKVFHHFGTFQVDMPVIDVMSPRISDGNNNQLDAGDKATLCFKFCNFGKVPDGPFTIKFSVDDPFVGISGPTVFGNHALNGYGFFELSPVIQINTEIPSGRLFHIIVDIYKSDSLQLSRKFALEVGDSPIVMYDLSKYHNTMAALASSFEALNTNFNRFEALDRDIFGYDIAFLSLGYGATTYYLSPSEDSLLVDFLDRGGKLYAESGFYFMTNSMLRSRLNINYGLDAIDFHPDTIVGRPDTPLEGIQFDYRGIATYILNLLPLETAVPWLTDKNSGLNFTVANDAGTYRTIATSINFDGFFPFESPDRKEILSRYLTFLGYSTHPLAANFNSDTRNICKGSLVHFETACGGNPISWHWTFEGGSPAFFDGPNPVITYENEGVYAVNLTVSDGLSENSFTLDEAIAVESCSAIQEERNSDLVIFPNPASDFVRLKTQSFTGKNAFITVSDLSGRMLLYQAVEEGVKEIPLSVSRLSSGSYLVTLSDENGTICSKMLR